MGLRHCPIETNMMAYDDLRTSVLYVHGIPCGVFPVALKPCDTMSRIRELIHYERQLHVHHGSFYLARGRKLVDGLTIEEQLIDDESNVWYHIGLRGGADNDPNNTKGSDEQFGKAVLHSGAIQCVIRDCEMFKSGIITPSYKVAMMLVQTKIPNHLQRYHRQIQVIEKKTFRPIRG
ncbi:uncharacterized protein [Ptychodera flava]|uniref:uncharacterized protein n=1 Tax=Ptychodera flava TaxID=63121 RepID=UPI00396A3F96